MQPEEKIILIMETFAKTHVNIGYYTRGEAIEDWTFLSFEDLCNLFSLIKHQWCNLTLACLLGASEYHNGQEKVFSWLPERASCVAIKSWPAFSLYVITCSYEG